MYDFFALEKNNANIRVCFVDKDGLLILPIYVTKNFKVSEINQISDLSTFITENMQVQTQKKSYTIIIETIKQKNLFYYLIEFQIPNDVFNSNWRDLKIAVLKQINQMHEFIRSSSDYQEYLKLLGYLKYSPNKLLLANQDSQVIGISHSFKQIFTDMKLLDSLLNFENYAKSVIWDFPSVYHITTSLKQKLQQNSFEYEQVNYSYLTQILVTQIYSLVFFPNLQLNKQINAKLMKEYNTSNLLYDFLASNKIVKATENFDKIRFTNKFISILYKLGHFQNITLYVLRPQDSLYEEFCTEGFYEVDYPVNITQKQLMNYANYTPNGMFIVNYDAHNIVYLTSENLLLRIQTLMNITHPHIINTLQIAFKIFIMKFTKLQVIPTQLLDVSIFDKLSYAITITDDNGEISYVNSAFEQITGYSKQDVLGRNPRVLKSGLTHQHIYEKMWETILNEKIFHIVLRNKKKNGELYWSDLTIIPFFTYNDHLNFIAFHFEISDITKKQREFEISKDNELFIYLLSSFGYDLANINSAIQLNSQVLSKHITSDVEMKYLANLLEQVAISQKLVQQILLLNPKSKKIVKEHIDFKTLLIENKKLIFTGFTEQQDFKVDFCSEMFVINTDKSLFIHALYSFFNYLRLNIKNEELLEILIGIATISSNFEIQPRCRNYPYLKFGNYVWIGTKWDRTVRKRSLLPISKTRIKQNAKYGFVHIRSKDFVITKSEFKNIFNFQSSMDSISDKLGIFSIYAIIQEMNGFITGEVNETDGVIMTLFFPTVAEDIEDLS